MSPSRRAKNQWRRPKIVATTFSSRKKREMSMDGHKPHEGQAAEHWMMLQKALLFVDKSVARRLIAISDASNSQRRLVKKLGRQVKNLSEETWRKERERVVLEGSLLKFRQTKN
jgi:ribA/ribD-fused uncharacterized protein